MASSHGGAEETEKLRKNITDQLDRLVQQLKDLEEYKDEFEEEELEEMKRDTKQQLEEFSQSLQKITAGNMSLVDEFSALRMAIQAAISEAFKTPEIISLFAKKQPAQLRLRLSELERDIKIQKLSSAQCIERKMEILSALKKLKDPLSPEEEEFLKENSTDKLANFELASSEFGAGEKILAMVAQGK